ncbi:metalloprotease, partial [Acinetobacter baumannii]|nr:metalloprotease [Acinetobacter baumannii]MBU0415745.1 metalloprotease [Acinetobacter baumannii]HAV7137916.1 metalloprotease [Acinetobacter baumannii]HCJ7948402.1 metalloprotease [Acinetobacter baumannii]
MKKILLLISGTLLCVSCTTRPPLLSERGPSISADGRPIVPVTFVFTTNTPQAT